MGRSAKSPTSFPLALISNRFDEVRVLAEGVLFEYSLFPAKQPRVAPSKRHWQLPPKLLAKKPPNKKKEKACIFDSDIVNYTTR
jgi:hypothetical protein